MGSWRQFFDEELIQPYNGRLREFLKKERELYEVYPPADMVFNSMQLTPYEKVKVVIVGQDPYHGPGQAMGLAFSVPTTCELPPSLRNIYQEIERDIGVVMGKSGDLTPWAKQGVLLLNTLLTVKRSEPLSHKNKGWEVFTDHLIEFVAANRRPLAFLLWGRPAQEKVERCLSHLKDAHDVLILRAAHPSPLSAHRGFLGCSHFSKVNEWLIEKGQAPVNWKI